MTTGRAVTVRRRAAVIMLCAAALAPTGCLSAPPVDNPALVRGADCIENPVLVSPGQPTAASYKEVFEKALDVLDDYFEIQTPNPYDGRITTFPRVAPGYEQFWKRGNPDPRQRLFATLQSVRQTATVEIRAGERGGYLVYVVVERELEDLARPIRATVGGAVFQEIQTVDRQVEVVTPETTGDRVWFKVGRDYALEQEILRRIRQCK
ncbi:MAG: hypothetical protein J0I06_02405 [Planctomycetes bacterium]|nr:hypothetical protein [Planctomycetota bacterium]